MKPLRRKITQNQEDQRKKLFAAIGSIVGVIAIVLVSYAIRSTTEYFAIQNETLLGSVDETVLK